MTNKHMKGYSTSLVTSKCILILQCITISHKHERLKLKGLKTPLELEKSDSLDCWLEYKMSQPLQK